MPSGIFCPMFGYCCRLWGITPSTFCEKYNHCNACRRLRAGKDTFSGICKANSMEQIRNANFSASLRDSSKNSKNSLKKPKVSSPSGREPLALCKARTSYCRARRRSSETNFKECFAFFDSARRGWDCNGCNLTEALRVQKLLYGLKRLYNG